METKLRKVPYGICPPPQKKTVTFLIIQSFAEKLAIYNED